MKKDPISLGKRIYSARLTKEGRRGILSQDQAAALFNVSLSAYRNWEKDRDRPGKNNLRRIRRRWPEVFKSNVIPEGAVLQEANLNSPV